MDHMSTPQSTVFYVNTFDLHDTAKNQQNMKDYECNNIHKSAFCLKSSSCDCSHQGPYAIKQSYLSIIAAGAGMAAPVALLCRSFLSAYDILQRLHVGSKGPKGPRYQMLEDEESRLAYAGRLPQYIG